MTPIERAAAAMKDKRRELIAQPLERIWPDLAQVAIAALREPSDASIKAVGFAGFHESNAVCPCCAYEGKWPDEDAEAIDIGRKLITEWIDAALAEGE